MAKKELDVKKFAAMLSIVAVLSLLTVALAQEVAPGQPAPKPVVKPLIGVVVKVATVENVTKVTLKVTKEKEEAKEVVVVTNEKTKVIIEAMVEGKIVGKDAKVTDLKPEMKVAVTPAEGVAEKIVVAFVKPKEADKPKAP